MRSYIHRQRIRRNALISRAMVYSGLFVLIVTLVYSFMQPANFNSLLVLAVAGTLLAQIGMPLYNRWGRRPRIDELLDASLKGLDQRFAVFHYLLGTSHALICPAGVFALVPRLEKGVIDYQDGQWFQDRPRSGILRRGGRRKLTDLTRTAEGAVQDLSKALSRRLPGQEKASVQALVVFMHPEADVQATQAPYPVVHAKKLKNLLRKLPKGGTFSAEEIELLARDFEPV